MPVLAIHLPQFRLERCGYRGDERVVLLDFEKNADRVQAATPRAAAGGSPRG